MKKKYGFTLVELLVVIVIVGILLLIAIPSVSKYLKRGTKEYYSNLENTVMLAGRDYFNDYRTLLPKAVDNVTVIELDELVENKYIDKVVDKNGKTCSGRVIAKKIRKSEYEYYTCLICEDYKAEEEIEACSYDENQNVTLDTKYYRIDVEKDYYEVNQGESFTLPYGKAYYTKNGKEELINDKIEGKPKTIDTNKLGTTTVTYYYKGVKKEIIVNVKDVVKPSAPEIVLKYDNANGKVYKEGTWSNKNIYAEFKSTDYTKSGVVGSGISRYEISEDNKATYNYLNSNNKTYELEQNKTHYVRSIDKSNNISNDNTYTIMIDKTKPSCSITADGSKTSSTNEWYTGNVSLTFNPTDNLSGVAISNMVVKKNDKVVKITNNTITEDGIYTVEGSVTDNAGNSRTCSIPIKIDKTPPSCKFVENTEWTKSNVTIKANCTDAGSGCTTSAYNVKTYSSGTVETETLGCSVTDKAGNTGTNSKKVSVKIDKDAPICGTTWDGESSVWTNSNRTITNTATDSGSGTTSKYSQTFSTTMHTMNALYIAEDAVGNTKECSKNINVYVDKTNPTISFLNASGTDMTAGSYSGTQNLTLIAHDNDSSLKSLIYKVSYNNGTETEFTGIGGVVPMANSGSYKVSANACDNAGNCTGWETRNYTVSLNYAATATEKEKSYCGHYCNGSAWTCKQAGGCTCPDGYVIAFDKAGCDSGGVKCAGKWLEKSKPCYETVYSCPNGGTLNNSTKMCEF